MFNAIGLLTNDKLRTIVKEVFGIKPEGYFVCSYRVSEGLVLSSERVGLKIPYPDSEKKAEDILTILGVYHPGIRTFDLKPGDDDFPVIELSMYLLKD